MRNKKKAREFYNAIAYKKIAHENISPIVRLMNWTKILSPDRNEVISSLLKNGERFLDIGVGEGNLLLYAQNKFRHSYGIDISRIRIHNLKRKKEYRRCTLSVQSVEDRLTFKNGYFDAISLVAVLEHVFDPHRALENIRRVLKPGGTAYIEVPNIAWIYPRLSLLLGYFPNTSTDPGFDGGHLHYFDIHNLTRLLHKHHFRIQRVTCSGFLSKFRRIFPSLLGGDLIVAAVKENHSGKSVL